MTYQQLCTLWFLCLALFVLLLAHFRFHASISSLWMQSIISLIFGNLVPLTHKKKNLIKPYNFHNILFDNKKISLITYCLCKWNKVAKHGTGPLDLKLFTVLPTWLKKRKFTNTEKNLLLVIW